MFTYDHNSSTSGGESVANLADVAYWDGSWVKTCSIDNWATSLGTPIGVVVIPSGFAPDGKARIVSLTPVDKNGYSSTSHVRMYWDSIQTDTILTNFTRVPTTDNAGSTSTSSSSYGYLPSDKFTGVTSYVDSKAKYSVTSPLIPSPYSGDTPNPEYYKTISNNNALSDFSGLSNTTVLVGLGSNYIAANAAYKYKDGASNLQWYLPAMGELGYLMPRFNEINNVIKSLGGIVVDTTYLWSSTEESGGYVYLLNASRGYVYDTSKYTNYSMRPFALLDNCNLISFTIDGTYYYAEEGMTWGEWVDSEYNVINVLIVTLSGGVDRISLSTVQGTYTIADSFYIPVITTQEIVMDHNYVLVNGSGGGGGGN